MCIITKSIKFRKGISKNNTKGMYLVKTERGCTYIHILHILTPCQKPIETPCHMNTVEIEITIDTQHKKETKINISTSK